MPTREVFPFDKLAHVTENLPEIGQLERTQMKAEPLKAKECHAFEKPIVSPLDSDEFNLQSEFVDSAYCPSLGVNDLDCSSLLVVNSQALNSCTHETLTLSSMVENKEDVSPMESDLAVATFQTGGEKTHVLNVLQEVDELLIDSSLAIGENRARTDECFSSTRSTVKKCWRQNATQLEEREGKKQNEELAHTSVEPTVTKKGVVINTCFTVEEVVKKDIEERNCPLIREKLEAPVVIVNDIVASHIHVIPDPTALSDELLNILLIGDEGGTIGKDGMVIEEDLLIVEAKVVELDAKKSEEVEHVAAIGDSLCTFLDKEDEIKGSGEEFANVDAKLETERYELIGGEEECVTRELELVFGTPNAFEEAASFLDSTNCVPEATIFPGCELNEHDNELILGKGVNFGGCTSEVPIVEVRDGVFEFGTPNVLRYSSIVTSSVWNLFQHLLVEIQRAIFIQMFKELLAATTISTNLDEAVEIGKPCLDRLVCLYRGYTSPMACSVGANEMDHFDIAEIIENSGKLGQDDLNTVEDREDFSSKYHEQDIMTEQIKYAMMKVMCCINLKEFEGAEKEHGSFLRFKHISVLYLNKKVIYMHSGCGDMTKCCNVYDVVVMRDFDLWQLMTKRLAFNRWDDVDSELIVKLNCDGWKLVVSDNEYLLFVDSKSVCKLHLPWQFMLCAIFIAENKSRIVLTCDGGTLFFKKAIEHMDASAFSLVWQSLSHPLDKFSKEFLLLTNYKMQCLAINSFPYFNIGAHGRMTTDSENSEVHIQLPDDMNTTTKVAKQKKIDPKMNTLVFADYLLFPFDPGGIISLRTRKFLKGRVMLQEIWVSAEIGSKVGYRSSTLELVG